MSYDEHQLNDDTFSHDGIKPKKKKKKKKRIRPIFWFIIFLVLAAIGAAYFAAKKYMPNSQIVTLPEAYNLKEETIYIILDGELLYNEVAPVLRNEELYLPVDFIKDTIDKYIFWESESNTLTITTENKVMRMQTDELTYYINNKPMKLNLPVYTIENNAYMPVSLVKELYNVDIEYKEEHLLALVDSKDKVKTTGKVVSKKTNLRTKADIKSPVLEKHLLNDELIIYDSEEDFTRVRSSSGLIGYIKTKDIGEFGEIAAVPKSSEPVLKPNKPLDGKITLVWDQVTTVEANSNPSRRINHAGIDVLSPTWFSFDSKNITGDIKNIADKNYVDWAHDNGYQVWALISDNFNTEVNHAILTDANMREHVIRQLLAFVSLYDLDGINIDFEALRSKDAEYYLQFLRELSPLLKEQGAVLSVDLFVPTYTKYYNRLEVGKVVDYVCVMTYDEHYSGSETSGPVASLPFVDSGIAETLTEVPKEKVLMGLPFYVRVWREVEVNGKTEHTIENITMDGAYTRFKANGAEFTWLPEIGSYYAEYTTIDQGEEATFKIWLEDERSIEEKLKLAQLHDVKGVACWKRGLESDGVFELIESYIKN